MSSLCRPGRSNCCQYPATPTHQRRARGCPRLQACLARPIQSDWLVYRMGYDGSVRAIARGCRTGRWVYEVAAVAVAAVATAVRAAAAAPVVRVGGAAPRRTRRCAPRPGQTRPSAAAAPSSRSLAQCWLLSKSQRTGLGSAARSTAGRAVLEAAAAWEVAAKAAAAVVAAATARKTAAHPQAAAPPPCVAWAGAAASSLCWRPQTLAPAGSQRAEPARGARA